MVEYDKNGNCKRCGLPGSGFVEDGVCECLNEDLPEFFGGVSRPLERVPNRTTNHCCNEPCRVCDNDYY